MMPKVTAMGPSLVRWVLGAIIMLGAIALPAWASRYEFRIGSLDNTQVGMQAKESSIALKMIMEKFFAPRYSGVRLDIVFLTKSDSLAEEIIADQIDILTITGLEYLELKKKINLAPMAILSPVDQPNEPYLLIARKGTTLESLATREHRSLMIEAGGSGELTTLWLDRILKGHHLPFHKEFFNNLRTADKPSRLLLPVFFGQADACIVPESAMSLMMELNPQIEEKVDVLERSPAFVNILVCVTDRMDDWARHLLLEETVSMHKRPEGRQILTIIQMKRFFQFKPEYFEATQTFYSRCRRSAGGDH